MNKKTKLIEKSSYLTLKKAKDIIDKFTKGNYCIKEGKKGNAENKR